MITSIRENKLVRYTFLAILHLMTAILSEDNTTLSFFSHSIYRLTFFSDDERCKDCLCFSSFVVQLFI
jgi:hypothetical protein